MGIDLKKVNAEMMDVESMLAAIDHDIEECRLRYFEHPWAWSQIRRALTFERHRLQCRLAELTFVCKCVGGRRRPVAVRSLRALAGTGKENTKSLEQRDHATFDVQPDRPTLRVIRGGLNRQS